MPELFDVASHFDDVPVLDGYTNSPLFYAQFSTFNEASLDGSVSQKRSMSTAPNVTIPLRRVVSVLGERWIIGQGNIDAIFGEAIRRNYWTKKALGLFTLLTPGQAALGLSGVPVYGHHSYLKDTVNTVSDSEYDPFWEIYLAPSEPVLKGSFLQLANTLYRVRTLHAAKDGLTNANSDELDQGARVAVTFTELGSYSPLTDTYTGGSVTTQGLLLDRYKLYALKTEADASTLPGDMTLVVAISAVTPIVGRRLLLGSQSWQVLAVSQEQDAWKLHIRRA